MSKTNHQRGYKAPMPKQLRVRYDRMSSAQKCQLADRSVCSKWMGFVHDRTNRRNKAGGKKFVRSRLRFHENAATRQQAEEFYNGVLSLRERAPEEGTASGGRG